MFSMFFCVCVILQMVGKEGLMEVSERQYHFFSVFFLPSLSKPSVFLFVKSNMPGHYDAASFSGHRNPRPSGNRSVASANDALNDDRGFDDAHSLGNYPASAAPAPQPEVDLLDLSEPVQTQAPPQPYAQQQQQPQSPQMQPNPYPVQQQYAPPPQQQYQGGPPMQQQGQYPGSPPPGQPYGANPQMQQQYPGQPPQPQVYGGF